MGSISIAGAFGQGAEPGGTSLLVPGPSIDLTSDPSVLLRCLDWEPFDSGEWILELSVSDFM